MKKNSLVDFIIFGTAFRFLKDVHAGYDYLGDAQVCLNLKYILNFFQKNSMKVTQNAAITLENFYAKMNAKYSIENNSLEKDDAIELGRLVKEIEIVVLSEALEVCAYFAKEKRYNSDHLFDNPAKIFGEVSFAALPEAAQIDFQEACRCILLERGTAAAFHLMRGAECSLKHLYYSVVKRGRKSPAMWANMVIHLEERNALSNGCKGMLDVFRTGFRNPTAHPDKFYSVDEAQDLLGTTTQLISLIISQNGYEAP